MHFSNGYYTTYNIYSFICQFTLALPNQQFDYVATGGMAPCFGEPPLPSTLPIPGADDELFSPSMLNGDLSPNCCPNDMSPTFEKRYMREMEKTIEGSRFIAQHVRNKDKFESVSFNYKLILL